MVGGINWSTLLKRQFFFFATRTCFATSPPVRTCQVAEQLRPGRKNPKCPRRLRSAWPHRGRGWEITPWWSLVRMNMIQIFQDGNSNCTINLSCFEVNNFKLVQYIFFNSKHVFFRPLSVSNFDMKTGRAAKDRTFKCFIGQDPERGLTRGEKKGGETKS